jgi:hypothetical protein
LLLEKLSKSLIPLGDCPFVLNRLPVFLGKSPCFRKKTDSRRQSNSTTDGIDGEALVRSLGRLERLIDTRSSRIEARRMAAV